MIKYTLEVIKMKHYYYNQLNKEEKKKIIQKYQKAYAGSEFKKRISKLHKNFF